MESVKVSDRLRRRMPVYLEHLKSLPGEDGNISATTIANALGMGHVLVRKDLDKVSVEGRRRTGRSRKQLIQDIENFMESQMDSFETAD
jgi:NADH/NAD ratio-sensing transcriptional regulator Rex